MRTFTIVIAAHGPLAAGFLAAAEMICGPQDGLVALGLEPDESPDGYGARLRDAINVSDGPALVLADLPGGTPHTVASLVARDRPGTWVIAGANLGIVVEAVTSVEVLDDAAVAHLVSIGQAGIVDWSGRLARDTD